MMGNLELFNKTLISTKACLKGYRLNWFYPLLACFLSLLFLSVSAAAALNAQCQAVLLENINEIQGGFQAVMQKRLPCRVVSGVLSCDEPIEPFQAGVFRVGILNEETEELKRQILFFKDSYRLQYDDLMMESAYNSDFDFFQNYDSDSASLLIWVQPLRQSAQMENQLSAFLSSFSTLAILILFASSFFTIYDRRKTAGRHKRSEWFKITLVSTLNCALISAVAALLIPFLHHWTQSLFLILYLLKSGWMLKVYTVQCLQNKEGV